MSIFLDKNRLLSHINDNELKMTLMKSLDIVESVIKNYEIRHTKFLNPYECRNLNTILKGIDGISYHEFGGYDKAERKIMYIYPDYFLPENIESVIKMIKITGNFKYREVGHRDYLGSILSLGLSRSNIGDICINNDGVYVVIHENFEDYIMLNLEKIANVKVQKTQCDFDDFKYEEPEFAEHTVSVSSLRLDAIVSSAFDISRDKAQSLIKNENVKVNYETIKSSSKTLLCESVISAKGYGRFIFVDNIALTKKNKIRILIKKYRK